MSKILEFLASDPDASYAGLGEVPGHGQHAGERMLGLVAREQRRRGALVGSKVRGKRA